ncbi:hypothetical protein GCM10010365_09970 [Streptomyces poonensis]|uniref:Uncharacterized protein n=1 Tax=Streptomyces poonensis TaxID=68255 RepID=A0A918P9X3_9ACTN|nr:hypothetical protein GCM10010365_09970 [Streptomyces poonensis]GLJ87563.1 hypothetical protein GCM10017589_01630 [Streptomyces poonensis]
MSTQADRGHTLVPRPAQTPDALRAALAVVDPARLPEMQQTKDEAFAKAVEWQSFSPVRSWVLAWARDIEIARRPDLATRHARARSDLEHQDAVVAREALRELSLVLDEAMSAVAQSRRPLPEGMTEERAMTDQLQERAAAARKHAREVVGVDMSDEDSRVDVLGNLRKITADRVLAMRKSAEPPA